MEKKLVARNEEIKILNRIKNSERSEFVAVYGRRRVGKTFLIRQFFDNQFAFYTSGVANSGIEENLLQFNIALAKYGIDGRANNWFEAFQLLEELLSRNPNETKIVFIDELPWFDTPKSNFIQALETFWNSWASAQSNIKLIVCGSSASWITDKLINNHGGLHNRLTYRIEVLPFTLDECKEYFKSRKFDYDDMRIAQCYMIMGGIPFYFDYMESKLPLSKNIDNLFFKKTGIMRNEFNNLYASLFKNSDDYIKVVEILSEQKKGSTRKEIANKFGKEAGSGLTKVLENLELCEFIRSYYSYGKDSRDKMYQLIDPYTLFYFNFIKNKKINDEEYWTLSINTPEVNTWLGYAFEILCLNHIKKIKEILGISGIITNVFSWIYQPRDGEGVQIDLVIDRADGFANICEIKHSKSQYVFNEKYYDKMNYNIEMFMNKSKPHKSPIFTMITTNGVKLNQYSQIVQKEITLKEIIK